MNEKANSLGKNGIDFPILNDSLVCFPLACENQAITTADLNQPFVIGSIDTPVGLIPQVSSFLRKIDRWGTFKARLGIKRRRYDIAPGLYALSKPDENSPVLVTSNYKMSFDALRSVLPRLSAWILVLDTRGVNVWCAAGKGTFGTEELVFRIESSGLKKIVRHRKLILPQLGAPGVAAHMVKKRTGFDVHYGPVRAKDLPAYLDSGWKCTPEMRTIDFSLPDRAALIPIEVLAALKPFLILAPVFFLFGGIGSAGFWVNALQHGLFAVLALLAAIISGAALHPLLLPYLPGRAFSVKGLTIGIATGLIFLYLGDVDLQMLTGKMEALSLLMLISAISAYLAMNFTGCATYTSLSGVKKEMRWALPAQISVGVCGFLIWITSRIIA